MSEERKNLVTCKPSEFLKQTVRLRKSVEEWMAQTDVINIRKRKIEGLTRITKDMTDEEAREARKKNMALVDAQSKKNISDILDAALEKCPEKTLEVLALMCFVEPEHVDDHKVSFYLANLADILADKDVLSFFTSLVQLEQTGTSDA